MNKRMMSIQQIADDIGRCNSYVWALTKKFNMKPDQPAQRRVGRPGLYDYDEFLQKAKTGLHDGIVVRS
jgi:hypothetical protein